MYGIENERDTMAQRRGAPDCTCPRRGLIKMNCPTHGTSLNREQLLQAGMPDENYADAFLSKLDTGDRLRKDDGKPRFDLIPPEPLFALSELYAFGAKKYAPRGWEEGMSWGRCFGALMRHAWKFWRGEDYDEETGAHHMVAVMWNAAAIYVYAVRKIGTDDRAVKS